MPINSVRLFSKILHGYRRLLVSRYYVKSITYGSELGKIFMKLTKFNQFFTGAHDMSYRTKYCGSNQTICRLLCCDLVASLIENIFKNYRVYRQIQYGSAHDTGLFTNVFPVCEATVH